MRPQYRIVILDALIVLAVLLGPVCAILLALTTRLTVANPQLIRTLTRNSQLFPVFPDITCNAHNLLLALIYPLTPGNPVVPYPF
jgi:hypothetical protein